MARFKRILKWIGIAVGSLVGLFILLVVLIGVFGGDSNGGQANTPSARATPVPQAAGTTVTPGPTAMPRPTATPIMVTANALERQHEANEVSWESKYVDKYILITGSISSITEAGSQYDVKLNTDNIWVNIVCKIGSANRPSVLELAAGEIVTVYGQITNDGIVDIVVKNCTVRAPQSTQGEEQGQLPAVEPTTSASRPTATPDIFTQYQGMAKKVAMITVYIGTPTGSGSGFLYHVSGSEEFVILTNRHVVKDHSSVEVCWALAQNCVYEQVKSRGSESFDVAVLEFTQFSGHGIDAKTLQWFASWYESNIVEIEETRGYRWAKGDVVYASGYPGGHKEEGSSTISDPLVTEGIIVIDGLASYRNAHFIEHGANIESGSSGGPLMNNAANIVGINTGTNLIAEQLELAVPMTSVIEWLTTGEEPNLTLTPRLLPTTTPDASLAPEPTHIPTPTATPHPTPAPKVGTRENPIPLGSSVSYPDWDVSVKGFGPNANNLIASASQYNDPPDPGYVYVMVEVQGTYTGTSVGVMRRGLNYYMVGSSNILYEIQSGISYDGLYKHPDVLQDGTATGNLAFVVLSDEVSSLLLIISDSPLSYRRTDATVGYFSLDASGASSPLNP